MSRKLKKVVKIGENIGYFTWTPRTDRQTRRI